MADSLDDLLDEVETKFCRSISSFSNLQANQGGQQKNDNPMHRTSNQKQSEGSDIDAVLQEILDDDWRTISSDIPIATNACAKDSSPQRTFKKCCPVFVGGSSITSGIGTSMSKRVCDQLRCTSCDFRVAMFDDHEWDSSCDYLFFRNNMPDSTKLQAKLKRRQGVRAYACQCSWHSAFSLSELRHIQQLKWVCGQHKDC
ncbi:protein C8orf37 homolog isoform X1 [Electrophorus electricus]|uniref:Cilia- and flagella-associated protein 418 n=1 Tax=Electrophorus electricus TaxID=8005 RepID=A0A4W4HIS0_ELEEL|nr:protein C8orf37 homolog isoform X1 [Electrophorus electricus]